MQNLKTTLIALALSSTPLAAQFTTPAGYLSTEGKTWQNIATYNGYSYYFGRTSVQHYQQVDAEIKKKGIQVLTSVGFRPDYRNHTISSAAGRNWSNVTVKLSDGDHATMSSTFAANQLSTPSMVFSGSVTWPHITGNPTSQPAPWSSQYAFPFGTGGGSGIYMYTANTGLCLDFTFTGGTLLNNAAWSGTSGKNYYLDGLYTLTATTYGRNVYRFIGTTSANCTDSAHTSGYASGSIQVGLYGKGYTGNSAWTDKAVMQIFGARTAPNSFVLHAIGIDRRHDTRVGDLGGGLLQPDVRHDTAVDHLQHRHECCGQQGMAVRANRRSVHSGAARSDSEHLVPGCVDGFEVGPDDADDRGTLHP